MKLVILLILRIVKNIKNESRQNLNMKLLNVKINKVKKLFHIYKPLKNVLKSDDQPTDLVNWMTVE